MNEIRIFGPPGTGKTTTLSGLIATAVRDYGADQVLVSSFTRTAAKELISRDLPVPDERVANIHKLCYHALGAPKVIDRETLAQWNAEFPAMQFDDGNSADIDDPYSMGFGAASEGARLLMEHGRERHRMSDPATWPDALQSFATRWDDFKAQVNAIDFTDMINTCLKEHVGIPYAAQVLFLDEVQDLSALELTLARRWGSSCAQVYLAGDDDQTLFAFKGASPRSFLSPELPSERVRVLSQSYRVPPLVHRYASRWVERIAYRMPKEYKPRPLHNEVSEVQEIPFLSTFYPEPLEPYVKQWLADGRSIALLASCGYMLHGIIRKLREWGLPYCNHYRPERREWNPLNSKPGTVSAVDRILAFRQFANGAWWTNQSLHRWASTVKADEVFIRGAKKEISDLAEDKDRALHPVSAPDLERWIPSEANQQAILNGDLDWLIANATAQHAKSFTYPVKLVQQLGDGVLRERPKILVGTIHSMKGGEADNVVLFPDLSASGMYEWAMGGEGEDNIRRMFYVGMTRAKCSLYWAQQTPNSIGGYL